MRKAKHVPWIFLLVAALQATSLVSRAQADEAEDQYAVAAGHYARGDWQLASTEFGAFLERHRQHARGASAQFFLAESLVQEGRHGDAATQFETFLEEHPDHRYQRQALFRAGECHYLGGAYQQARPLLERFITAHEADKLSAYVLSYLGDIALRAEDHAAAEAWLRKADPRCETESLKRRCRLNLARALQAQAKFEEAAELFTKLAATDQSGAADALFELGACRYAQSQYDAALTALDSLLKRYPDFDAANQANLGRGWALYRLERYDAAARVFTDLQDDAHVGHDARYWLSLAQIAQGDNQEAAQRLMTLSEETTGTEQTPICYQAGESLLRAGDATSALKQFERAEQLQPEGPWADDALLGQMRCHWHLEQPQRIVERAEVFQQRFPESGLLAKVRRLAARAHISQAQYEAALPLLRKLMDASGDGAAGDIAASADVAAAADVAASVDKDGQAGPSRQAEQEAAEQGTVRHSADNQANQPTAISASGQRSDPGLSGDPHAVAEPATQVTPSRAANQSGEAAQSSEAASGRLEDAYLLALALQGLKRHEDALPLLEHVLAGDDPRFRAEALLAQASAYLELNQYAQAVAPLVEYISLEPRGHGVASCRANLAIVFQRIKQRPRARQAYVEFASNHFEDDLLLPTTHHLAELVFDDGDFVWAKELFGVLIGPRSELAYGVVGLSGKAWCEYRLDDLDAADADFRKLLETFPADEMAPDALWMRGRIAQQQERFDAALVHFADLVESFPKSARFDDALLAAARLHDRLQHDRQAATLYEQLAEQFPDHPEHDHVLYEWAWVLREADQLEASDRVFQELRQRHPDSTLYPDATFRLAQRRFQTQEHAEALELVEELIDADAPRKLLEPALYLQGEIAATLKRWKDVAEPMQRLVREFPDGGWRRAAEYWIAEAQFRQDHFVEAQAMFDALGEATEEDPSPWLANVALRRAQCLAHQKQWSQARVAAQRVVADYPEFELRYEVDYVLGRCLASEGRMEDAREAYRRVIRSEQGGKSETAAMAQWMIGESYFHQKDYQAAIREYLRVEILYAYPTWQAAALLQTGKCYEFLGQTEKAHESYSRLIESFGETPFAQQAARRLNPANQATAPGNRPAS